MRSASILGAVTTSLAWALACSAPSGKGADDGVGAPGVPSGGVTAGAPSASGGPARCTTAKTRVRPGYLQVVVDGSVSMLNDHKWEASVPALDALVNGVAQRADNAVGLGLMVFADTKDPTAGADFTYGPYPSAADVPVAVVDSAQAAALRARLQTTPKGITPTLAALKGAYTSLRAFVPAAPLEAGGKKFVLFLTDGYPFASLDGGPPETDVQVAQSLKLAEDQAKHADPILTFVVGVGPFPGNGIDYDATFVGRLATAGRTARVAGCNPIEEDNEANVCHFQVTPGARSAQDIQKDILAAVDAIRVQASVCEFVIEAPPTGYSLDPDAVTVQHRTPTGVAIILPGANGWSFDDPQKPQRVVLKGAACERVRGERGELEVLLGCK